MPCYDKKLEASRDNFVFQVESQDNMNKGLSIAEVDSVLTSGEILELVQVRLQIVLVIVTSITFATFYYYFIY